MGLREKLKDYTSSSKELNDSKEAKTSAVSLYEVDTDQDSNEKGLKKSNINEDVVEIDSDDFSFVEGDINLLSNSPYPEVRANVSIEDDPSIVINHWRTWFLTTLFVIVFSAVNMFFSLRYPSLTINYLVAQVIVYPIGKFLARVLPDIRFKKYPWFNLNPGPYTIKEHGVLTICVALAGSNNYAMGIVVSQTKFFGKEFGIGYEVLLNWTTQCLGYGLAGLTRKFIVDPPSMIWPQTLISVAMFEALHSSKIDKTVVNGWKISRYSFFLVVLIVNFVWYWFPGFIFKALSYFNFILWGSKTRNNFVVNFIFGVSGGIGAIPLTFDYTQVSQAMNNVFATPYWVSTNVYASVFIFFIVILPILYFTNAWDSKYLPIMSTSTFDNKQKKYDVNSIMGDNFIIDYQKYKEYSPLFVPFSYLLSYALNFAAVISLFFHCGYYHWSDIWAKFKDSRAGGEDIHRRLYSKYKEVPNWWYASLFILFLGLSFLTTSYYDTGLPAWGLVVAILISVVTFLPQGLLEGTSNLEVGLNIITEMVGGYILPYRPLANLLIKVYGFIVMRQGLNLSRDLKLGLYLKIAPRILFFIQIYSTLLAGVTQVLVYRWMKSNVDDLCSTSQSDGFICAGGRTLTNAAIIWSIPQFLFTPGKKYSPLLLFFIIGPVITTIFYLLHKKFPKYSVFRKFNGPIFFVGPGNIPPATPYNYGCFFVVSSIIYWIRSKWPKWDAKYRFVLGAGVETGVAIATVIIFLCVQYPTGGKFNWWGNTVYKNTLDYEGKPYYTLKEGETFGETKWW
ncbi:Oligopeptide transporter [Wickerhamomyces ciferrii]|uniref:Oligopeptide transporter n=1 Tax=Wickerhamomyces ciferrii (strain ATCC 14091 / BCRC 22168 / CBS 111 / JCM 3599 / NBRC 0793 / NRRL Y-1031 F-60-10) TaxID=1206466 RepID=K0KJA8_WICCF|nr:Oligopeptide transporter [Wickerhamomyces ciferrii]CCH41193.1 Oligopeptide transporter [Wickerhamomyces ciferrii]